MAVNVWSKVPETAPRHRAGDGPLSYARYLIAVAAGELRRTARDVPDLSVLGRVGTGDAGGLVASVRVSFSIPPRDDGTPDRRCASFSFDPARPDLEGEVLRAAHGVALGALRLQSPGHSPRRGVG